MAPMDCLEAAQIAVAPASIESHQPIMGRRISGRGFSRSISPWLIIPDALSFNLGEMKSDSARINELLVNQRFRYLKDLGCNRFFVDEK
jgi:hypothetical protein